LGLLRKFLYRVYVNRSVIWAMAWREIRTRYAGTLAGMVWSVVHPLAIILIYWFIFSKGLKVQPAGGVPFIIAFLCGLIPWTAFAETLSASTHTITGNVYLVKKTLFPTEVLPFVHLLASMISHLIMLTILAVLLLANGFGFSFYNLQFFYYLIGMSIFAVGLGWMVSALNVFYRDVGQILAVVLNLWFWLTPVVWPEDLILRLPGLWRIFPKLNPLYYVVHGYRASFYLNEPFWSNWKLGLYFWVVALGMFAVGGWVFRRLKPDFPEVL